MVYELTSLMGFDGIWMDFEHHALSVETGGNLMRAARVGVSDIIVRPAKGEFMRMQRMLEAGAQGIMYPRCDDAEEAAEVVAWAKFAPEGKRGCDGANPDMPYLTMPLTEYLAEANRETFIIIQIEQINALENVEKIAAVEGVDVLMLGPGDLGIQMGIPGQIDHPMIQDAMQRIAKAAAAAGKHWACPTKSVQDAKQLLDLGARLTFHRSDLSAIRLSELQIQRDFAPLGFTFDNQFGLT